MACEYKENKKKSDVLELELFYKLMQAYRNAPVYDQADVSQRFEDVKHFIRVHFRNN